MGRFVTTAAMIICLCFWSVSADAAVNYTVTQTNPAPTANFNMRTTSSVTFRITNTSTAGETIRRVRFRIRNVVGTCGAAPCANTLFSNTTAAPAGWTRSAFAVASVTFTANTVADRIPAGGTKDFTMAYNMGNMTADFTQTLRDVRATFSTGATRTINNPGSWKLLSLSITSFQTTDCAGTPIATLTAGNNFCVVMAITNISSTAQNGIVSSPTNTPSCANISKTGTVTQGWVSTTYNPNPLNLAALASGTITFRYSTVGTDNGTIQFVNLIAQRIATVTSMLANSNILSVSRLTISITVRGPIVASPTCVFSGDTATFTMTATNNTGASVTNVTPSALTQCAYPPCIPTVTIGALTGPLPACIASIANGASGTFTWTVPVTGTINSPKSNFYVTGNVNYNKAACGAGGGITSATATSNTEDIDGYIVTALPATTNANSANEEIIWAVTNLGCAAINSVAIAIPGGWTYSGDNYSIVDPAGAGVETWTTSGTVTFTADAPANQIATPNGTGEFHLVFSATPTATGANTFNVVITDTSATPNVTTVPTTVTVNPYDSTPGQGNYTTPGVWRESY